MPYLIQSTEWRLVQTLGELLSQRRARYQAQLPSLLANHGTAELLEFELRRLLMVKTYPQNLELSVFQQCEASLNRLCALMNDLADPRIANTNSTPGQTHPRLRALVEFLERTSGAVDLVAGPNQTIFTLPQDAGKLRRRLDMVTKCNNELDQLLESPPQEPVLPSTLERQKSKTAWKKARIRAQATFVLGKVFEHFRCETSHEVLLKLFEDFDEHSKLPGLQLMLSPCDEREPWQEAQCDSSNFSETAISSILDICTDRRQYAGQGMALMLLIQEYALFGAWGDTTSAFRGINAPKQSLDQLIQKGAFKPTDLNTLFNGGSPAEFSAKDKRALAVKLGYCLMDFFDVDVGSNTVFFLGSSTRSELDKDYPYLAFGFRLPARADSYNDFDMGHPTLLSFAKLLLEIDFGQRINLDIKPHNSQNRGAWLELLTCVDTLAQERDDSYLQAVRGCLVVHEKIAKALRSHKCRDKGDSDSIIRKKLYKEVVRRLEGEVAQSMPRPAHKRQRSESPPPSDHSQPNAISDGGKGAMRSKVSSTFKEYKEYKKRRILEAKLSPSPGLSYSSTDQSSTHHGRASSADSEARSFPQTLRQVRNFSMSSQSTPSLSSRDPQSAQRPMYREEFEIAIICALPLEYNAVSYLFDEFWDEYGDRYGRAAGDPNSYTTGRMGNYNVVLALLPHMGKVNAAGAAASMRGSYSNLRLALLVGVCGAAPYSRKDEILLGDVIISKTVVQHDFGRQYADRFIRKETTGDSLGRANKDVRNLVAIFETDRGNDWLKNRTTYFLKQLQDSVARASRQGKYDHPGLAKDRLYKTQYRHKHHKSKSCSCHSHTSDTDPVCDKALDSSCTDLGCDEKHVVERARLRVLKHHFKCSDKTLTAPPAVHVGAVASGDGVIKSAAYRDMMSTDAGVIAFEMEGAGIWDEVPSIVVKGACDYADSHKNKDWQDYAAATAASACKAILEKYIRTDKVIGG